MTKPDFSYSVPENFNATILAEEVEEFFTLSKEEKRLKSNLAKKFAKEKLSIEKMTDFYLLLYKNLKVKTRKHAIGF